MASTLNPDALPTQRAKNPAPGHDVKSLGPSDSSDSGSDMAGPGLVEIDNMGLDTGTNEDAEGGRLDSADAGASVGDLDMDDTSDRFGTGEHAAAGKEPRIRANADRDTDRVVGADEAGLGGGLDQAEEAQLGITDEELDRAVRGEDER